MDEPQEIWQNQQMEEIKVPIEFFRLKAVHERAKSRWIKFGNDVVVIVLVGFLGYVFTKVANPVSLVGLVFLMAGCLYSAFRRHSHRARPVAPGPGVEEYVRELERARDEARDMWRVLAPVLPGALLFAIPLIVPNPKVLVKALPFCILLGIWFALAFPVRRRRMRALEKEIDILKQS